jgi:cytosine/adenosine deaminase-related metal-dependent hydrolase
MGEMRLAALLQKWRHGPESFTAVRALNLVTRGGAEALGAPGEIGSLEVGRRADLVILNPDDLHSMAAESVDLHTRIVFGSDRTNVESVYVDGRAIYDRGAFPGFDLDEVRSRAREELKLLLKRREAE